MKKKLEELIEKSKGTIVKQCGSCKKIKTYHGYRTLPDPVVREIYNSYGVSHGYCKPCLEKQQVEILIMERIYAKNLQNYKAE